LCTLQHSDAGLKRSRCLSSTIFPLEITRAPEGTPDLKLLLTMGSQFTTILGVPIVIGVYLAKSYLFGGFNAL
jgi:hypothetical protein